MTKRKKKEPLPFSITIHGIGYSDSNWAIFTEKIELFTKIEELIRSYIRDGVDVDLEITHHAYTFRAKEHRG